MSMYFITGGSDQYWWPVFARTLRGAKAAASRRYHAAHGGRIEVAVRQGDGYAMRYETVAVKCGHDKWQDAP